MQNKAGRTAYLLAEERGTDRSLECAGYLLAQLPDAAGGEQADEEREEQQADQAAEGMEDLSISAEAGELSRSSAPQPGSIAGQ